MSDRLMVRYETIGEYSSHEEAEEHKELCEHFLGYELFIKRSVVDILLNRWRLVAKTENLRNGSVGV